MANPNDAPSPGGKPAVIRGLSSRENLFGSWLRMVPAWIISGVAHGVILGVFFLLGTLIAGATGDIKADTLPETEISEPGIDNDLSNPDIGLNPDVPLNYNVDRIEDVSVPGPVDASQAIGIPGAPADAPVANVPAPAGFGGGLGGGLDGDPGKGGLSGLPGGMGGIGSPGGFAGRSGSTREKMVTEGGGNPASEAAVGKGLMWLATHQAPDGSWKMDSFNKNAREKPGTDWTKMFDDKSSGQGMKNDTAGTAFGLLPFLAAGQTHRPTKEKNVSFDYSKQIQMALNFLMAQQGKNKNGDLGGGMYSHGLATIALCEAYGLTSDPALKASAQAAINYIVYAQDEKGGGWRYAPKQAGDTSVVGWQVMALKSGQMSGLSVPPNTLKLAEKWLDNNMSSDKGDYGYIGNPGTTKDTPASSMTAVGLLCRQYLGWSPRNEGLLNGVSRIKKMPPGATRNMYYYYYATQVMHHMGGESWEFWNPKMRDTLIKSQDQGTNPGKAAQKGSWDPAGDGHGAAGGRIMITSLSLLTLEVYYRHLPLYRRDTVTTKMPGDAKP